MTETIDTIEDKKGTQVLAQLYSVAEEGTKDVTTKTPNSDVKDLPPLNRDEKPEKKKRSMGEILHWLITHMGIDWILNSSLSLFITFNVKIWSINSKKLGLKDYKPWEKLFLPAAKGLTSPLVRISDAIRKGKTGDKTFEEKVESGAELLLMLVAGTLVIPLMKWFTERKDSFVGKVNLRWKKLLGREITEEDEEAAKAPVKKESWAKWLSVRAVVAGIIYMINNKIEDINKRNENQDKKNPPPKWAWKGDAYKLAWTGADKIWRKGGKLQKAAKWFANKVAVNKDYANMSDNDLIKNKVLPASLLNDERFKSDRTKAMFADQMRIVWKEVSLTFILAFMLAGFVKIADKIFGKKKKEGKNNTNDSNKAAAATENADELSKYTESSTYRDAAVAKKQQPATQEELFATKGKGKFADALIGKYENETAATEAAALGLV